MGVNKKALTRMVIVCIICAIQMACKKSCYNCNALTSHFRCYKGVDTIYVITYNVKNMEDTIGFYVSEGYACDTLGQTWNPAFVDNPICGKDEHDNVTFIGDSCSPI